MAVKTDGQLAKDLIDLVRQNISPQAVQLQERIDNCLHYLEGVKEPNTVTLSHVRRYLDGTYDGMKV